MIMVNDKLLKISVANSRKAKRWATQEIMWSAMVQKLSSPVRMAETFAEYKSLPKSEQDELKDVGGFVGGELKDGIRRNGFALNRCLITLDADNIPPGGAPDILRAVDGLGCAYAIYSTRKHESAAPRLRIVFPLDMPCTADEYEPIARKIASYLYMNIFDPTTFEVVRFMYWASISSDGEFVFQYGDKPFISKEGMLNQYTDWHNVQEWPEVPGATKVREKAVKKQVNPLEKQGIVGAFCKVYDVPAAIDKFLSNIYEPCGDGRYTYIDGSTVGGAVLYDNGNFIYSHHATDPAGDTLCNSFDLVRLHLFQDKDDDAKPDTPNTSLPSFKAMRELAMSDSEVSGIISTERYEKAKATFLDAPLDGLTTDNLEWIGLLEKSSQTGLPQKTIKNVCIILQNDPHLKSRFYLDEFANRVMVISKLPWESCRDTGYKTRPWKDEDDAGLRGYLEEVYKITGKERIYDGYAIYTTSHKQNKLREYLTSLKWDGVHRLDTLLIDYFGTEDTEYTRIVIRKTLVAAVARAMDPGVKFDIMLILSGPQGVGKSTFFAILGKEWFSDSLTTFEGKDASELIQGYWIIESGELTGFNKQEMNTVKQFLSRRYDIYRMPYGRRTAEFPRCCIIVGTTNDKEFLKDVTGNRRFWPVDLSVHTPTKSVFKELPEEVDQIWAEAVIRYRIGEKLYLEGAVLEEAMKQQEEHRESNPKEGIIREFLERKVPVDWNKSDIRSKQIFLNSTFPTEVELIARDRICAAEIWCECFKNDLSKMQRKDSVEINGILSGMTGWEKLKVSYKFGLEYGSQKGWKRK